MPPVAAAGAAIASAFGSTAIGGILSTTIVGTFTVGQAVVLAGSFALQAAAGSLQKNKLKKGLSGLGASAAVNNAAELSVPQRDSNPAQRIVFGRATTAGAVIFSNADSGTLHFQFAYAAHEIKAFERFFINDTEFEVGIDGKAYLAPYFDGTTTFVETSVRLGATDQTIDPLLDADFADLTADYRQRGHATITWKLIEGATTDEHRSLYGEAGRLSPRTTMQGIKCYDPRDPAQSLDDQSTWTWTDNAALCFMRYLTLPPSLGCGLSDSQIDWDRVALAADECDRWMPTLTGQERQFTVNGVALSTNERFEIAEAFEAAMSGALILSGDKVYPLPAQRRTASVTLHDDILAGAITYTPRQPKRDRPNIARIELVDAESDYQIIAGPSYRDESAITADGEELPVTQRFAFVLGEGNASRAQRLAKFALDRAQLGKSLVATYALSRETVGLEAGDVVRIEHNATSWVNGIYEVKEVAWSEDMLSCTIKAVAWSNDLLDWTPATDEQTWVRAEEEIAA
jgi:hypothetical protein